jgi:PAS domain S-box-containing protein
MRRSQAIVAITVSASIVVLLVAGAATYHAARTFSQSAASLARSKDRSLALERIVTLARAAETGQRGFLLTERESYLEPYRQATAEIPRTLQDLRVLFADDRIALSSIDRFENLMQLKQAELARTIELERAGSRAQALQIVLSDQGRRLMEGIEELAAQLQARENRVLTEALESNRQASLTSTRSVMSMTLLSIAILAALLYVFRRDTLRLRESQQRLATTLQSIGDAVIATDAAGRVALINPVAAALTGWPALEAQGRSLDEVFRIVNEDTRVPVENPVAKVLREGGVVGLANHTVLVARDGREIAIEDSAAPISAEPASEVQGVVLVFRDATAEREAARALREADRRKDDFLAVLAHELRNPLAPIRQAALIARSAAATEAQLTWSQAVIDRQVGHMARLLDDLLDVSRITRGKLEVRKSPVELSAVLDAAIEIARPLLDARHHALTTDLPPAPVVLDADPMRLAQVLGNLLTNAAKYTEPHGQVKLTARRSDDQLVLRVADSGQGLKSEDLVRVFDMFVQVGSPLERTEGGLGIGLALAKGLIELHGGTIEARSDGLGRGSEFIVRLPAGVAGARVSSIESADVLDTRRLPQLRIVVADDNHDAAKTLATLLELEGHAVEVAHTGEQALRLIETSQPDMALLDIGMPTFNGYEVARRIREQEPHGRIKLIAVTGWGQAQDLERARGAGFDHHLVKPIETSALLALCAAAATDRSLRA